MPLLAGVYCGLLGGAALAGLLPRGVLFGAIILCAITFTVYWRDKAAAIAGRYRTRERTLHLLAAAGGWPGALVAQRLLRHKSVKLAFQRYFRLSVAFNCALTLCLVGWWNGLLPFRLLSSGN